MSNFETQLPTLEISEAGSGLCEIAGIPILPVVQSEAAPSVPDNSSMLPPMINPDACQVSGEPRIEATEHDRTVDAPQRRWGRFSKIAASLGVVTLAALGGGGEAQALQRGDVAVQPDGKLGSVVGKQFITLNTEHSIGFETDYAWLTIYNQTCAFATDPWSSLQRARSDPYPTNQIWAKMGRSGSALVRRNSYLKAHNGAITILADNCDGDPDEPSVPGEPITSQTPVWEPRVFIGTKDIDKDADTIRERTGCTGFDRGWWEYRVKLANKSVFREFSGLDLTIPWPYVGPASVGIRVKFGETQTLSFPVCTHQNRTNFTRLPTLPKRRLYAGNPREEVAAEPPFLR